MSGPCLSSSVPDHPLKPGTRRSLGEPLPHQQADRARTNPQATAEAIFNPKVPWGINPPFGGLSPTRGYVVHVLLTRAPLESTNINTGVISFDLHVLNTPPAFVLSQNQTLRKNSEKNDPASLLKRLFHFWNGCCSSFKLTLVSSSGVAPILTHRDHAFFLTTLRSS